MAAVRNRISGKSLKLAYAGFAQEEMQSAVTKSEYLLTPSRQSFKKN
jgi:hypothetical protein